jgi:hypothetical protein
MNEGPSSNDREGSPRPESTPQRVPGMFGYWGLLVFFALFTTGLFGPVLHEARPPGQPRSVKWLFVPGLFQLVGMVAVVVLGFCFRGRVRRLPLPARRWIGVLLGCLSLPCGFALHRFLWLLGPCWIWVIPIMAVLFFLLTCYRTWQNVRKGPH